MAAPSDRTALILAACALTAALAGCMSVDSLNSLPFATEEGERLPGSLNPLGPLLEIEWKESTVQWGMRPLFSVRHYRDIPADRKCQYDVPFFAPTATLSSLARRTPPRTLEGETRTGLQVLALYPFFMHESCGEQSRTYFIPLYYNDRNVTSDGGRVAHWGFFPLYFGGNTDDRGPYHAVFPIGGVLKNWFGRDKIRFVLWPLYSHATTDERESYNFPWPFINYSHGGGRDRWYFWPLIGRYRRHDQPARWFFLWPFFWYGEPSEKDERPVKTGGMWPLAGWYEDDVMDRVNVVWPLYFYAHNKTTGRSDHVSWPLVRIGDGKDYYRRQFWPFFGYIDDKHIHRHYVVWPVYRREKRETEHSLMSGYSILILYRSIYNEWEGPGGAPRSDYENIFWPFWYYKRDGLGNTYFGTLALRGVPDPQGWDRFYSFAWRVLEHEKRTEWPGPAGNSWHSTRALWSIFRYDRDERSSSLRVFPLFSSEREEGEFKSFHALFGAFGFADEPGKRTYRILFIPWTVDREEQP